MRYRHTPRFCCCTCGSFCASLSGFAQFVLSVLLLVFALDQLSPAGECPLGASSEQARALCNSITGLALATIFSGMLLFVCQGLMSVLCAHRGCVDVSGRGLLAAAWLVTATLSTIQAAKTGKKAPEPGIMWAMIGMCWAMFMLSTAMAITTMVQHAAECCAPESPFGPHSGPLALCAEVLCVAWLVRWLTGQQSGPPMSQGGYTFYTPVAGSPGHAAHGITHSRQQRNSFSGYHEHLMHAHVPITVVHPVSEHLTNSFYGPMGGGGAVPHQHEAPTMPQFPPPFMQASFGQAPPAVGVPIAQHAQYPEILPSGHAQYPTAPPAPMTFGKDEPSAPPMPPGKQ